MFVCFIQYTDFFVIIQHNLLSKYFECENLYITSKETELFLVPPGLKSTGRTSGRGGTSKLEKCHVSRYTTAQMFIHLFISRK